LSGDKKWRRRESARDAEGRGERARGHRQEHPPKRLQRDESRERPQREPPREQQRPEQSRARRRDGSDGPYPDDERTREHGRRSGRDNEHRREDSGHRRFVGREHIPAKRGHGQSGGEQGRGAGGRDHNEREQHYGGRPGDRSPRERPADRRERAEFAPRERAAFPPRGSAGERVARAYEEAEHVRVRGTPRAGFDSREGHAEPRPVGEAGTQVCGVQPVLEALRAGSRPIERVTIAEGAHESRLHEIVALARAADVPIRRAPRTELQRLVGRANHQGVVATIAAARYRADDELLAELTARVGTADSPLVVVLDGVEDPRNLGAIIRTIECAGAHAVFVPERRAAGLTETTAKAAAGALEYVPVARTINIARLVDELKQRGIWTVGTAADAETDYTDWDWTQPCALLLGGEGEGLRRLVRERCDALVRIPLRGRIESLNVSVAAGVILYEALRQRTAARGPAYKAAGTREEAGEAPNAGDRS
jgi:23S rRNA (guanosine2251-2'-O)-methyltransferase